jgi:peptidoglycan hydrolase-like protein with peptidoglycan-binding domain
MNLAKGSWKGPAAVGLLILLASRAKASGGVRARAVSPRRPLLPPDVAPPKQVIVDAAGQPKIADTPPPRPSGPSEMELAARAAAEAAKAASEAAMRKRRRKEPTTGPVAVPAPTSVDPPPVVREPAPQPSLRVEVPVRQIQDDPLSALDIAGARREARNVARHLYNSGGGYPAFQKNQKRWAEKARSNYARSIIKSWQAKAGLVPDGIYGPRTHNALKVLGAPLAPPSLFRKRKDGTYWTDRDPRAQYTIPGS